MRKVLRLCRASAVSLACLAWLLPVPPSLAAPPISGAGTAVPDGLTPAARPSVAAPPISRAGTAATTGIIDVRLDEHGAIHGRVLDAAGQGLAERPVVLQQVGGTVSRAQTDAAGRFVLQQVSGGVHQLTTGQGTVTCRVWTHTAAPPSATDQLTVVAGEPVVRGQQPFSCIFTNPLFIGLVVAAAIAIPIAVHNAQDDQPSGS